MKKNWVIFCHHMLESIKLIEEYTRGKTEEDFLSSSQLQDSVIRRIEMIGEAVKNIPSEVKDKYHEIPWKEIAGMRDILIHQYFGIDLSLTWEVIRRDLPELKRKIIRVLEQEGESF